MHLRNLLSTTQTSKRLFFQKAFSIFLVDHAWTFRPAHARKQLEEVPNLLQRMAEIVNVNIDELSSVASEVGENVQGDANDPSLSRL